MKRDQDKTKGQLLNELAEMRQRIAQLEASEAEGKKAEEALRHSEEELIAIYNNAPIIMMLVDEERRVRKINLKGTKFAQRDTEEMIGLRGGEALRCMYHLDDPEGCGFGPFCQTCKVRLTVLDVFKTGKSHHQVEATLPFASRQEPVTFLLSTVPLDTSAGRRVLVSIEDITERKQLETELRRIEKLESLGTLAGGIAHDFNNLLTGIMGNIGLAKRHLETGSKAADRLDEAEKASYRARDLTQQLLTFATGGAPTKKTLSITVLIKDSTTFALRGSNVRCQFSLPDDLWAAEIDEGQMNQVITNLVINADEAMPEGGVLNIGAKNTVLTGRGALPLPKGNYIEITIEDHGAGISEEHLERIFEPYFTTKQKGSGLGLATAYSIIRNHDGYITVESELGIGTTLRIYLHALKKRIPRKRGKAVLPHLLGGGRVLVMDDEEIIREMLNRMLLLAGYEVELTGDGAEAIEKYAKAKESGQPFDAVILDLTVPGGMGGKEAIKKLLEIDPNAKVIVSSGYVTDLIMADFKKYGFSAVATKPYSVGELEKILRRIIMGKGK